MDKITFRPLKAEEIEVKIASVRGNGIRLMLWKNNLATRNILNETVGEMNWQIRYLANNECAIDIWDKDKNMWVTKSDFGSVEIDKPEYEKRLASDSMKRAGSQWGIGTELYTAPFMWVGEDKCNVFRENIGTDENGNPLYSEWKENGNYLKVLEIEYNEKKEITYIKISNTCLSSTTGKRVTYFSEFGTKKEVVTTPAKASSSVTIPISTPSTATTTKTEKTVGEVKAVALNKRIERYCNSKVIEEYLLNTYNVKDFKDLTESNYSQINLHWDEIIKKVG